MKAQFLLNMLLTLVWVFITGDLSLANFIFAFLLSFGILWLVSRNSTHEQQKYFVILPKIINLILFFFKELVKANLQVAYEVMTPKYNMKPGIIALPLDVTTDFEIVMLANFISLTPGTFSIDVSTDRKTLYVHGMYVSDREKFIHDIKHGFEKRILEISR
ncbi:Na+/H+ antiporter subunit E [Capnocytophaga canimorsus]|uniref:Na+/H+ antiporter subunit E n=1 Tax=Capnocytophaga canimorsus TaxID=28188 RepID=A0AAD0E9U8_9FLAO|nr:Na+/H+ antiporter subunit E [Capnocytophaga canimorsus]ATA93531.1 Na+/H+ antiporter subunit E [Capnocytophaga canimorsus]